MAINDKLIRLAMRNRMINATNLNPASDIQFENMKFNPTGKQIWIAEYITSGDEFRLTNGRSRIRPFIVQYNVYVPLNKGTNLLDEKVYAIEQEFDINTNKSNINVNGYSINVYDTKLAIDTEESWYVNKVILYLDVIKE